jgi:hypothetical protein
MEFFFKPKNIAVVGALAKLFSLSRRYRFRNMIDDRGHVAATDDTIMIASGRQLLGIGQHRHIIELPVAVVALAAQAGNIAIQRATVRLAGSDLLNRRHRNAAGK